MENEVNLVYPNSHILEIIKLLKKIRSPMVQYSSDQATMADEAVSSQQLLATQALDVLFKHIAFEVPPLMDLKNG